MTVSQNIYFLFWMVLKCVYVMFYVKENIELYHYVECTIKNGGKSMNMKTYTEAEIDKLKDETDWERVRNMSEDDIDYSDIPMMTDEILDNSIVTRYSYGKPVNEANKTDINLRINIDIIDYFKSLGDDWQNKINEALSQVVKIKNI